jgi:hypothetical protein
MISRVESSFETLRGLISPVSMKKDDSSDRIFSHEFNIALGAWLTFIIVLTVRNAFDPMSHTNYTTYEYGARRWWSDENMYFVRDKTEIHEYYDYRYGPVFSVFISPLVLLPTPLGSFLFIWGNAIIYYLALRGLIRHILPGDWTGLRQAAFLLLTLLASHRMFWALQINPTVFAAVAGAAIAVKNQRWWLASFLLAFAVAIKAWPLAAALLFCACWPRQIAWRFVVAFIALSALPFLTRPPQIVCQQFQWWWEMLTDRAQLRLKFRDAWTFWELIQSPKKYIELPVTNAAYKMVQLTAAALALLLCLWQKSRRADISFFLTFLLGLWISWQMIFGPGTERNTFGILAPLSAWALIVAWERPWNFGWMSVSFLLTAILSFGMIERSVSPQIPWILAAHPLGAAMFVIWLIGYAWQLPRLSVR